MYLLYNFAEINWPEISSEQDFSIICSGGLKIGAQATSVVMEAKNISLNFNISPA